MPVKNAFDPAGREQYIAKMNQVGYVEFPTFTATAQNYCCTSCPAMIQNGDSVTGYWCRKAHIPDKPNGCCDLYYPFPEIQKILDEENQSS